MPRVAKGQHHIEIRAQHGIEERHEQGDGPGRQTENHHVAGPRQPDIDGERPGPQQPGECHVACRRQGGFEDSLRKRGLSQGDREFRYQDAQVKHRRPRQPQGKQACQPKAGRGVPGRLGQRNGCKRVDDPTQQDVKGDQAGRQIQPPGQGKPGQYERDRGFPGRKTFGKRQVGGGNPVQLGQRRHGGGFLRERTACVNRPRFRLCGGA